MISLLLFKRIIIFILSILVFAFIVGTVPGLVYYNSHPLYYKELIGEYSKANELDPYMVSAIIKVESRYNKDAISPKDARGLMQIGEQTGEWGAKELEINDYNSQTLFDPEKNIRIGTWYLSKLRKEFGDRNDIILAAYNGGSGNVSKWLNNKEHSKDGTALENIPFKETREYVKKVNKNYETYKKIYKDTNFEDGSFNSIYIDYIYNILNYFKDASN